MRMWNCLCVYLYVRVSVRARLNIIRYEVIKFKISKKGDNCVFISTFLFSVFLHYDVLFYWLICYSYFHKLFFPGQNIILFLSLYLVFFSHGRAWIEMIKTNKNIWKQNSPGLILLRTKKTNHNSWNDYINYLFICKACQKSNWKELWNNCYVKT